MCRSCAHNSPPTPPEAHVTVAVQEGVRHYLWSGFGGTGSRHRINSVYLTSQCHESCTANTGPTTALPVLARVEQAAADPEEASLGILDAAMTSLPSTTSKDYPVVIAGMIQGP
eukprot:scaffold6156_cov384-Prasinococcus_capsulatus_cf.AAC.5